VRGRQTGKVDTCRVEYLIENKDGREHRIGLRFLLDTFIGTNDGAPFILPGEKSLCDTVKDFKGSDKIPAFAQALEQPDFKKPGAVAHLNLKVGGGVEAPGRVTFGGWPNPETGVRGAEGFMTKWAVPLMSMKQNVGGGQVEIDAAATLYWMEKALAPGKSRRVGFTYGLGNFNSDTQGQLGLILAGPFQAGGEMTVLTLVKNPRDDQTVSLKVPAEMELTAGDRKQPVPPGGATGIGPVTWTVRTPREGVFALTVETSTGTTLRQGVRINPNAGGDTKKEVE